jgi:asparagine synthase (glutamine-hydrolysing)
LDDYGKGQLLHGPLRARVSAAILGPSLASTGMFNQRALRDLLDRHLSGTRDHSAALWSLLMFDGFLRAVAHEDPGRYDEKAVG